MKSGRALHVVQVAVAGACLLLGGVLGAQPVAVRMNAVQVAVAQAAGAGGANKPDGAPEGLHLERSRQVSFTHEMTDGEGYRWDIQYYGNVGQGTNYAYGSGMYLQVNGNNVPSGGQGYLNEEGDELEVGPQDFANLHISRRVKVYKDRGLARWLDIFENKTSSDVTVQVRVYSSINYGIQSTTTPDGDASIDEKEGGFVTESRQHGQNSPTLGHIVCGKRADIRPNVQVQGNNIFLHYNQLTVPAGETIVLCHFEAQNASASDNLKMIKSFRAYKALKDLPPAVRRLIANFSAGGGLGDLALERAEAHDTIIRSNGDPTYGTILASEYAIETFYGRIELPAGKVVGMVCDAETPRQVRAALVDGQIVAGRIANESIGIQLAAGGKLDVPLDRIAQWSYRISEARPDEAPFAGPTMQLRTGDRLRFDPDSLDLALLTRHGRVEIEPGAVMEVAMDNPDNGVHRATFVNGSMLGGMLEPADVSVSLLLGPRLEMSRDLLASVVFSREEKPNEMLAHLVLTSGSELFGRVVSERISVETAYGTAEYAPENIRSIALSPAHLNRAVVTAWDGSVLRGRLSPETLRFRIEPGPELTIYVGQIASLVRMQTAPPEEVIRRVRELVAQLGAESYQDRQAASKELVRLGAGVAGLLRDHLDDADPEVRHRVEDVLEQLGAKDDPAAALPDVQLEW